jgi:hypothetical protein
MGNAHIKVKGPDYREIPYAQGCFLRHEETGILMGQCLIQVD